MTQNVGQLSRQPFAGFQNGAHLCDVLDKPHNGELKEFTRTLFQQISNANQSGRQVNPVAEDKRFLDAVAQIITGNEVCGAIAISGRDILIATNKGTQDKKSVSWSVKATLLERLPDGSAVRLGLTCYLESIEGNKIEKRLGPVEYRIDGSTGKAVLIDNPDMEFKFLESEFSYLPGDSITVTYRLNTELDDDTYGGFAKIPSHLRRIRR